MAIPPSQIRATDGKFMYNTVRNGMKLAGVRINEKDPSAILVWYDTLRPIDYFSSLNPWQIVNRLPNVNVLCRKATLSRLLQRVQKCFHFSRPFYPNCWILPQERSSLSKELAERPRKMIVKPDGGSLGIGITILEEGIKLPSIPRLSVAQEYIESFLLGSTKFDLRIYVLIASVNPLTIYVYRDGVARFCSQKASESGKYSQITNTHINKENPNVTIDQITKTVSEVFSHLKSIGANIQRLWQRIDRAIVYTAISAIGFLSKDTLNGPYTRCFQLLGFDILLDKSLNPYILEVNYRPMLSSGTDDERRLKEGMIKDVMGIVSPGGFVQSAVDSGKWEEAKSKFRMPEERVTGRFAKVFPSMNKRTMRNYRRVMKAVMEMDNRLEWFSTLPPKLTELPPSVITMAKRKSSKLQSRAKEDSDDEATPRMKERLPIRRSLSQATLDKRFSYLESWGRNGKN